ncbi:MAG: SDR family oxidoreductase [Candidatus Dormibacteraeota bacterium]|uniref:SDR family oxidoreductase n=1 Tax=Candidatus Dormiibacter inghamiae TaxID=3127013 RepID=A0A934KA12_9BACT|nr:SDR family oxidoreductase [Candidatus Dormibacteraeota bacterium]MBJ7606469.1 SDR family oxidoreductase [Candidatus Dormibacteraeota bacterium]
MNRSFAGRRALITGAGRGIGRGAAIALASAGAEVTLVSRTRSELEEVAETIRLNGGCASVAPADVSDPAELEAVFEGLGAQPADILVTAAGINRPGPLVEVPVENMAAIVEVNVLGTLWACRAFAKRVIPGGQPAAVVTLSSQMGTVGYPGRAPYCASKHAVNGLTKALALEWAPQRIRVNAVAPTFVKTALTEPMFRDEQFLQTVLSRIPAGRLGEVDDVVGAICFLLSDEASLITGHILAVDGGWTAQ